MSSFPMPKWFSSLRRPLKNQKTKPKYMQRSCVDLSTPATSKFYITRDEDANYFTSSKHGPGNTIDSNGKNNNKSFAGPAYQVGYNDNTSSNTNTNSNNKGDNDDRCNLLSATTAIRRHRVSQLCSRCCCQILPDSRSSSPPPAPTLLPLSLKATTETIQRNAIPHSIDEISSSVITTPAVPFDTHFGDNQTHMKMWSCDRGFDNPLGLVETTKSTTSSSSFSTSTTITTEKSLRTDVSQYIRTESSATPSLMDNHRMVFNKRTEFRNTRTLTITRPIELLLNDRGEIVDRRRPPFSARSNSFGGILDEKIRDISIEEEPQLQKHECGIDSSLTFANSVTGNLRNSNGDEWQFIDDCSTESPSENEIIIENEENAPEQPVTNLIYDKINGMYCDNCRIVIYQNDVNVLLGSPIIPTGKQIKDELCEVASEMEALDVPEDCKHSNKEKQMSIGRKKFNMDPKKGIEYLVENRLLRHDPQDVAHFLYKGEGLNKTAIGDYLGEKNEFNEDVLKAFVALHDFTNLILVQALRQFLWSFRLPGEAQKIDRMMECFAQRYCHLNPDIFTNTDTCYVLSFAIIMLNTSLHNPSVKDKPTVEQFISMNRGINNGGDLPRGLLESLYESIRTEPFKIPQDDGNDLMHTFFNPDKEGWLWKQGGRYKSWKRRWFILNDNCLYYFEYTTDKEPRGIIPLENISVREIHDRSKPYCFELFATGGADIIKACKTDSEGKVVEGKHTVYRMSAATEEDQQEWIKRLTQSISHNPFYDILIQRKKKALSKS